MDKHEKIDYVEFPAHNLEATKTFFNKAFDWPFQDFCNVFEQSNSMIYAVQ